jgi:hypothetical protein
MRRTIHEIPSDIKEGKGKSRLMFCRECDTRTVHTTPFFGFPFSCVARHDAIGKVLCSSCRAYVEFIVKVTVDREINYQCLCELCAGPDSPERQAQIEARKQKASKQLKKLLSGRY